MQVAPSQQRGQEYLETAVLYSRTPSPIYNDLGKLLSPASLGEFPVTENTFEQVTSSTLQAVIYYRRAVETGENPHAAQSVLHNYLRTYPIRASNWLMHDSDARRDAEAYYHAAVTLHSKEHLNKFAKRHGNLFKLVYVQEPAVIQKEINDMLDPSLRKIMAAPVKPLASLFSDKKDEAKPAPEKETLQKFVENIKVQLASLSPKSKQEPSMFGGVSSVKIEINFDQSVDAIRNDIVKQLNAVLSVNVKLRSEFKKIFECDAVSLENLPKIIEKVNIGPRFER